MKVEISIEARDELGEGPVWSEDEQALYWVDIQKRTIQRWNPSTKIHNIWTLPSEVGSFAFRESGGFILALRTGFSLWNIDWDDIQPIIDPEAEKAFTRFNDGKCDRSGRFWAGTMDEEISNKRGGLYLLDQGLNCTRILDRIGVSNGLGWSPDNQIFYYTDSADHAIYAYNYDQESGSISRKRVFAQTPDDYVPDGLTVDSQGFIWSANWDGWKITRYDPNGSVDLEIPMPVQRPTSVTFGGPLLNKLYITSARIGLSETELEKQSLAGSVFIVETEFQGIPEPKYAG